MQRRKARPMTNKRDRTVKIVGVSVGVPGVLFDSQNFRTPFVDVQSSKTTLFCLENGRETRDISKDYNWTC